MSPPGEGEQSTYELSRALGIDRRLVARSIRQGMPRNLEGAKAWRAARVRPYQRPAKVMPMFARAAEEPSGSEQERVDCSGLKLYKAEADEDLGTAVQWLRDLVKTYRTATREALERGDVARADALARQLQSLTRNLAATERVWTEAQEQYGGLVSRERLIRFFLLYKKSIDNAVCDLPESDRKDRLIDTLDRITMQLRADLKAGQAIA